MSNDFKTYSVGALTTTSGGGAYTTVNKLTAEYLREAQRNMSMLGSTVICGGNYNCRIIDETTDAPKDTMTIPEPKSVQCPKCEHRAIKGACGTDWTMDVTDHDVTQTAEKRVAKENGNRARLRICAKCGNVWATILRTEEA